MKRSNSRFFITQKHSCYRRMAATVLGRLIRLIHRDHESYLLLVFAITARAPPKGRSFVWFLHEDMFANVRRIVKHGLCKLVGVTDTAVPVDTCTGHVVQVLGMFNELGAG